jgi:hypothetical protein
MDAGQARSFEYKHDLAQCQVVAGLVFALPFLL